MTDNTALAQELEACPFCGGEAHIGTVRYSRPLDDCRWAEDDAPVTEAFYGHCARCSAGHNNSCAGGYRTRERAIAAWNTRTPAPAPVGGDVVERVAKAIHEARMVHVEHEERWDWDQAHKPYYHDLARAALAAMPPSAQEGSHERA